MNIFFCSEEFNCLDLGFGSVFDDIDNFELLPNISTQSVMDLIRNVTVPKEEDTSSIVEIGGSEVEEYFIPRNEEIADGEIMF